MGGVAMQGNTKKLPACRVVADFTEAMNILDGVLGIPTGNQSLSQLLEGVGENIQKTRLARGMNQGELAQRAGVDRGYISLVENGKQNFIVLVI